MTRNRFTIFFYRLDSLCFLLIQSFWRRYKAMRRLNFYDIKRFFIYDLVEFLTNYETRNGRYTYIKKGFLGNG